MDGKGRWVDNVFVERLWRSLKYEEVYLKAYETVAEARLSIGNYFRFYNRERKHQSLDRQTPDQVYEGSVMWPLPHDQVTDCVGRIHLSGCPKIGAHFWAPENW